MIRLLPILLLLGVIYGPHLWVRYVLKEHGQERSDFPGSGGELARHLLDELRIEDVVVERTDSGDHYSPGHKAVRLEEENLKGRSLTAIAVAAHEVGHAIQDAWDYTPLKRRTRWIQSTQIFDRIGSFIIAAAPVVGIVSQSPALMLGVIAIGLATMAIRVVAHLVTLPVEYDASFNRALPMLEGGGYLAPRDLATARQILWACALTYVASALVSLFNIWRWLRLLRFR
jgi:Zn-dependent membrane protease YugP